VRVRFGLVRCSALVFALLLVSVVSAAATTGDENDHGNLVLGASMLPGAIRGAGVQAAALNGHGAVVLVSTRGIVQLIRPGKAVIEQHIPQAKETFLVTLSDDGSTVAGTYGVIRNFNWTWRVASDKVSTFESRDGSMLALTSDGARLATGGFNTDIFDLASGKRVAMTHNQPRSGPDGSTSYSDMVFGNRDRTIVAAAFEGVDTWSATTGKRTAPSLDCPFSSCQGIGLALSKDGRFVGYGIGRRIVLWNVSERRMVFDRVAAAKGEFVYGVAITPDGSRVSAGTSSGLVVTYDTRSGKELGQFRFGKGREAAVDLTFSDDGHTLLVENQPPRDEYVRGMLSRWIVRLR
jgi:WD40 repeat protein